MVFSIFYVSESYSPEIMNDEDDEDDAIDNEDDLDGVINNENRFRWLGLGKRQPRFTPYISVGAFH